MLEPPTYVQWTYINIGAAQLTMVTINYLATTLASTHGWTQTTSIQYMCARYSSKYRSAGLLSLYAPERERGKVRSHACGKGEGEGQPQRKAWLVLIGVLFSLSRRRWVERGDLFVL
jgi:hypothetical protein